MIYTPKTIETWCLSMGHKWFTEGNYNLNIVGIRTNNKNKITNKFDDIITISYLVNGIQHYHEYPITTEPGIYYSKNLLDKDGVAILVPGQYRATWQIGLHRGKYQALTQIKAVKVYRDKNKDDVFDLEPATIDTGLFGINIHRSNPRGSSEVIDKWSAGCQVFKSSQDFNIFINTCKKASKIWGNKFTYTLLEEQ